MKTKLQNESSTTSRASRFAKRSFEIYKEHYKSRNLVPTMTLDEFMKNYRAD